MSPKNWNECPRCVALAEARRQRAETKASTTYGKVPAAEWLKLKRRSEKRREVGETLREDYSIGIDETTGRFAVRYDASCETCGYSFGFRHEQDAAVWSHAAQADDRLDEEEGAA